jgi:hypothetical protein
VARTDDGPRQVRDSGGEERFERYPRTRHLEGSALQPGDEDLTQVPFSAIEGRYVYVEEKVDGSQSGVRFDGAGEPLVRSRGHFVDGKGLHDRQFALLRKWLAQPEVRDPLLARIEDRYEVFGEWMLAAHSLFYDSLPAYLLEFDIRDLRDGTFLGTPERRALLRGTPVRHVHVLWRGRARSMEHLVSMVGRSRYKSPRWREALAESARRAGQDPVRVMANVENTDLAEGVYVKVEEGGRVVDRLKYVRHGFLQTVFDSDGHWMKRPVVPNLLDESAPETELDPFHYGFAR